MLIHKHACILIHRSQSLHAHIQVTELPKKTDGLAYTVYTNDIRLAYSCT